MEEYSMREAMEKSGCTRKAIRYYESQRMISPARRNGSIRISATDVQKLKDIHLYMQIGFSSKEIQNGLQGQENEMLKLCVKRVENNIDEKHIQLNQIERMLDNLSENKQRIQTLEELLTLNDTNIIHDMMVMPWRKNNLYIIREITCTKKEYHLLRFLMRLFTISLGVILALVILERVGIFYE